MEACIVTKRSIFSCFTHHVELTIMPPKKAQSATSKTPKESCCVCCQPITIGKDECLFCSGSCQHWLHRYCARVSSQCYAVISEKAAPFMCFAYLPTLPDFPGLPRKRHPYLLTRILVAFSRTLIHHVWNLTNSLPVKC